MAGLTSGDITRCGFMTRLSWRGVLYPIHRGKSLTFMLTSYFLLLLTTASSGLFRFHHFTFSRCRVHLSGLVTMLSVVAAEQISSVRHFPAIIWQSISL